MDVFQWLTLLLTASLVILQAIDVMLNKQISESKDEKEKKIEQ